MAVTVRLKRLSDCCAKRWGGNIDYYHLISGQDFPCKSNKEFDAFFDKHHGTSYMLYDTPENRALWLQHKYPSRFRPFWFYDVKHRKHKLVNFAVNGCNKISSKLWIRKMIPDVYAGWNWFSWHRKVVEFVLQQEQTNPKFFKRFHYTQCCDEVIFHTLLHPHLEDLCIDPTTSLRYVNWNKDAPGRKTAHAPLLLNEEEYQDIKASDALFCRKIHPAISQKLKALLRKDISGE